MTTDLPDVCNRLLSANRAGSKLLLLFDYDGTLTPIVQHPQDAVLSATTRELLEQLKQQPRLVLGILSGRSLDDLKEMAGMEGIYYAGTSGMELDLRGVRLCHPEAKASRALVADLAARLEQELASFPGVWVERKPLGLTVHYRALEPVLIPLFEARIHRVLRPYDGELRVVDGPMAVEIIPAFGWTKGNAVSMIVEHSGPGSVPLYAGDEANDEEALTAARALGGFALGIGAHAPAVAVRRLPAPNGLMGFLRHLLDGLHALYREPEYARGKS